MKACSPYPAFNQQHVNNVINLQAPLQSATPKWQTLLLANIRKSGHVIKYRIQTGIQRVHDLVSLENPVPPLQIARSQNIQSHQLVNGVIGCRESHAETIRHGLDRHHRLPEQQLSNTPNCRVPPFGLFAEYALPASLYLLQVAE